MTANAMEPISVPTIETASHNSPSQNKRLAPPKWPTLRTLMIKSILRGLLSVCYFIISTSTNIAETLTGLFTQAGDEITAYGNRVNTVQRIEFMTLGNIPHDTLVHLFRVMHDARSYDVSATCIGLSCSSFYRVFKSFYLKPIPLAASSGVAILDVPLFPRRRDCGWEPRYCLVLIENWKDVFVSIEVYDEEPGISEERLIQRHEDHYRMRNQSLNSIGGFPSPWKYPDQEWYIKAEEYAESLERELQNGSDADLSGVQDYFVTIYFLQSAAGGPSMARIQRLYRNGRDLRFRMGGKGEGFRRRH
ncbi:hypothetical protein ONS96_005740 [Cadophora gregata f. sp. sojae]|nr:hypothetical protein ONS96_005740 [Cadophora gregata f. sp. sojae]